MTYILDLPDDCLLLICKMMDLRAQCNFAFTCRRFQELYQWISRKKYRHFNWCDNLYWSQTDIQAFFKLNGNKMELMSILDAPEYLIGREVDNKQAIPRCQFSNSKARCILNICVYLPNLRTLILCVDHMLNEIIVEITLHMSNLQDLTIDSTSIASYELLALLPKLKSLDIEYLNETTPGQLFRQLAASRPDVMQQLRVGSQLKMEDAKCIAQLVSLKMINLNNPNRLVMEYITTISSLRAISLSNSEILDDIDFIRLLTNVKGLSSVYVCNARLLTHHFVYFAIKLLENEHQNKSSKRSLPLYLEFANMLISPNIKKNTLVRESNAFVEVHLKNTADRKVTDTAAQIM